MKISVAFIAFLLFVSCVNGRERSFTGSTPANSTVRSFLGIPQTDSIDFIRWKLEIDDGHYTVQVNYGIGKPNTRGFINGGNSLSFSGPFSEEKNYWIFIKDNRILKALVLNDALLHLASSDGRLLVGTSGWSYTLSGVKGEKTAVRVVANATALKDSMKFSGRTPCNIPGIANSPDECPRIKWSLVLYSDPASNQPTVYRIRSTLWKEQNGKTGKWKIVKGENGQLIYQLDDENGKAFLHLLKLDDHLLIFTDAKGNAPVGDEDFSYTLNGK